MARRGLWHAVLVLLVLRNAILASAGVFSGNDILALMAVGFVMPVRLPVWRWALGYYFGLADGGLWNAMFALAGGWLWYAIWLWLAVAWACDFDCQWAVDCYSGFLWRWAALACYFGFGWRFWMLLWNATLALTGVGLCNAILTLSGGGLWNATLAGGGLWKRVLALAGGGLCNAICALAGGGIWNAIWVVAGVSESLFGFGWRWATGMQLWQLWHDILAWFCLAVGCGMLFYFWNAILVLAGASEYYFGFGWLWASECYLGFGSR